MADDPSPALSSSAPCIVPTIEHGRLKNRTLAGALVTHGSVIEVECDERFELAYSLAPSLCYNGTWTHYPRCQPGGWDCALGRRITCLIFFKDCDRCCDTRGMFSFFSFFYK